MLQHVLTTAVMQSENSSKITCCFRETKLVLISELKSTGYTYHQKFTSAEQCIEKCWPNYNWGQYFTGLH